MDGPQSSGGGGKRKKKSWQRQLQARHGSFKQQQQYRPQPQPPLGSLGFFGSAVAPVPSLEDLRAANRQRTRHHFGGPRQKSRRPPRSTPKTIPRAPEHEHAAFAFPPGANPLDTPALEVVAQPTAADKLEAEGLDSGLDFYGTNEGMLFRPRGGDSASEQSELEEGPSDDEGGFEHAGRSTLLARIAEQEATIATLEDENLRLRERLDMLQQELEDLRQGRNPDLEHGDSGVAMSHDSPSSEDRSVAHRAAAAAADEAADEAAAAGDSAGAAAAGDSAGAAAAGDSAGAAAAGVSAGAAAADHPS